MLRAGTVLFQGQGLGIGTWAFLGPHQSHIIIRLDQNWAPMRWFL